MKHFFIRYCSIDSPKQWSLKEAKQMRWALTLIILPEGSFYATAQGEGIQTEVCGLTELRRHASDFRKFKAVRIYEVKSRKKQSFRKESKSVHSSSADISFQILAEYWCVHICVVTTRERTLKRMSRIVSGAPWVRKSSDFPPVRKERPLNSQSQEFHSFLATLQYMEFLGLSHSCSNARSPLCQAEDQTLCPTAPETPPLLLCHRGCSCSS